MSGDAFGLLLRRFRILHSLTQEQLAERAGLSSATVAALERGRRQAPRLSTVRELASALGLDDEQREELIAAGPGRADMGADEDDTVVTTADVRNRLGGVLPVVLTPLIGRATDIEAVCRGVLNESLVTLIGPGGVGKSRLALAVADALAPKFGGGARWVDLGRVDEPDLVADAVLAGLDATGVAAKTVFDGIVAALEREPVLLVLDGCEHVRPAVSALLAAVRGRLVPSVLATSRQPLHLGGEVCWLVPALASPDPATVTGETLIDYEAAALFIERALRHEPTFVVDDETAVAVAGICQRLDGNPLAIELAAGRVRLFSTKQLVRELDDRFEMLTARDEALPMRHQSLLASVQWGYGLLDATERAVLFGLSAFPGPFTLQAAEAVSGAAARGCGLEASRWAVLDAIAQLIDKSVVVRLDVTRDPHYRLHETMRMFVARQVRAAGLEDVVADALTAAGPFGR